MFLIEDFPKRLSDLRTAKGASAREMSLDIGQNEGYIQNIESGKALPSMRVFFYICEYLQISPSEFFDEGNPSPGKLQAIMTDLKKLNEPRLELVHGITKEFLKK